MPDPTRPLSERTPDEIGEYVDDHIVTALNAADLLHHGARFTAEDFIRDRLIAISDSWPDQNDLAAEEARRRGARLRAIIFPDEKGPE